ncbi:MAG TPA: hypothetical protein PKI19_13625 [Elusimicrobiales bacterium]|nr:hypothetical protein [Elusimicrobiales bacterium]
MLRLISLYFTDRGLWAAVRTISDCGRALGDLALKPGDAQRFFRPRLERLSGAAAGGRAGPALAAAEDFAARLQKFFMDLELQRTAATPELGQALAYLQAACPLAGELTSPRRRAAALEKLRGLSAAAAAVLRRAKTAAQARPDNFPQNLKFSSMYSDLEAVFDAFERCAVSLYDPGPDKEPV